MIDTALQTSLARARYLSKIGAAGRRAYNQGLTLDQATAKAEEAAEITDNLVTVREAELVLKDGWYQERAVAQVTDLVTESAPSETTRRQVVALQTILTDVLRGGWVDRSEVRVRIVQVSEARLMVTATRHPGKPFLQRDGVWFVGVRGGLRAYPDGRTVTGRAAIAAGWE